MNLAIIEKQFEDFFQNMNHSKDLSFNNLDLILSIQAILEDFSSIKNKKDASQKIDEKQKIESVLSSMTEIKIEDMTSIFDNFCGKLIKKYENFNINFKNLILNEEIIEKQFSTLIQSALQLLFPVKNAIFVCRNTEFSIFSLQKNEKEMKSSDIFQLLEIIHSKKNGNFEFVLFDRANKKLLSEHLDFSDQYEYGSINFTIPQTSNFTETTCFALFSIKKSRISYISSWFECRKFEELRPKLFKFIVSLIIKFLDGKLTKSIISQKCAIFKKLIATFSFSLLDFENKSMTSPKFILSGFNSSDFTRDDQIKAIQAQNYNIHLLIRASLHSEKNPLDLIEETSKLNRTLDNFLNYFQREIKLGIILTLPINYILMMTISKTSFVCEYKLNPEQNNDLFFKLPMFLKDKSVYHYLEEPLPKMIEDMIDKKLSSESYIDKISFLYKEFKITIGRIFMLETQNLSKTAEFYIFFQKPVLEIGKASMKIAFNFSQTAIEENN